MGTNRPSQLFWPLALLALAACSTPVGEVNDAGSSGSTGGATTGGLTAGGTGGSSSSGGSSGGVGSSGGASSGGGSSGGTIGGGTGGGTGTGTGTGGGTGGTTGGALGQNCLIQNNSDPCSSYGLVCRPSTVPGEYGWVCTLPGEFEGPCFAQVGCSSADLHCLPVAGPICVRVCQATADCPTLWTNCQTSGMYHFCSWDLCTPSTSSTFGTCDSAGTGDGTCLAQANGAGICLGGGTAVAGSACLDHRTPTSTSSDFCAFGQQCLPFGQPPVGHCTPLCGGPDGGPTCPSPTFCVPSGQGDWGYCL
jgi:hypothetical protein